MYLDEQRVDYEGGAIENLKERIFRIRKNPDSEKSWFELFAEFLDQPNVGEVEAISIGWWFTEEEFYEEYEEDEDRIFADLPQILEAIVGSHKKLGNLKFLYLLDGDYYEYYVGQGTVYPAIDVSPILNAFPQLEYFGTHGFEITDLNLLSSKMLKHFVFSEAYTIEDQTYDPSNKATLLQMLGQSDLPNLKFIHLDVYPYQNFPEAVAEIRAKNSFAQLHQIICPDPVATAEDNTWNVSRATHDFLLISDSERQTHEFFGSLRTNFTGE
jgi:hypothetical protein